jgi:putative oxidoreductase
LKHMIKKIINPLDLSLVFRIILGLVFIYSGAEKIANPAGFAVAVQNYRLFPIELTNLVAIIVPWLEFYCGLFLFFARFRQASAAIISTLIIFFLIALSSAMVRGLDIDCGCFGGETNVSWFGIIEDLVLLAISLYLFKSLSE